MQSALSLALAGETPDREDGSVLDQVLRLGAVRLGYREEPDSRAAAAVRSMGERYGALGMLVNWVPVTDEQAALKGFAVDAVWGDPAVTTPGGYLTSELSEVLSAAFHDFASERGRYANLYQKYLGVRREAPAGPTGRWIATPTPGSTLDRVVRAGVLRLGFWRHAPYQFSKDGQEVGFDRELGDALVEIMARHYPGLRGEWLEQKFVSDGRGLENLLLFEKLAPDMLAGHFDVMFTGVIQRPDRPVAVAAPTLKFFWTAIYSGKDGLDLREVVDRESFVRFLAANPGLSILSTPGGPSQDTVAAIAAEAEVQVANVTVPELIQGYLQEKVHFLIGDAIALADLAMQKGLNLNIELRGNEMMAPMTALD